MNDWKPRMERAVRHFADQLTPIRGGTVDAGLVESVRVVIDGRPTLIGRLATVANQTGRIVVRPYDVVQVPAVVKSLTAAGLGAYAQDPRTVIVTVLPISGEERTRISSHARRLAEEAKVAVRMVRQDARKGIAATGRGSERRVQEATDRAVAAIDALLASKLKEIGI